MSAIGSADRFHSRLLRFAVIALLAAGATASDCSFRASTDGAIVGPDDDGPARELDFRVRAFDGDVDALPVPVARGGLGRITVEGGFAAPCRSLASDLEAALSVQGRDVTLRVEWRRPAGGCPAALELFEYEAVIDDLSAGTYRVRVEHPGAADVGFPEPAFRGEVEVR